MRQSFGEYLRQLRRQQGLTQSELGADQFSKSYVSAVERSSVIPSHSALLHFAEKLQQPPGDFEELLQQSEQIKQSPTQPVLPSQKEENDQEILSLLDMILKGRQKIPLTLPVQLMNSSLFSSSQRLCWQERQARLLFLNGLVQQENGELSRARVAFEQALALAGSDYHPFISDALGTNYALTHDYISALRYHQRALTLFKGNGHVDVDLLQQVAYHCGDDCRALSYHAKACLYFEEASQYLQATSNLASAGKLYLGWGYCTYAALFQRSYNHSGEQHVLAEEIERNLHLAESYLQQSHSLYQVSSDIVGEMHSRLTQVMVLIDWNYWKHHRFAGNLLHPGNDVLSFVSSNLLDDAYEQCQQIFQKLIDQYETMSKPPAEIRLTAITAIAYLIRIATRRAMHIRLNNSTDTDARERRLATCLCERLLTFFESQSFSWDTVRRCAHISGNDIQDCKGTFDFVQAIEQAKVALSDHAHILTEVCFAFGVLAEEIALVDGAREDSDQLKSFQLADQCFQQALTSALHEVPGKDRDTSYVLRVYQRYATILEQRMYSVRDNNKELVAQALLVVKEAFINLPGILMLPLLETIS